VKHSKLWEIYTLISLPPKLLPYFIPFLNSHILHLRYSVKLLFFTRQSYPFGPFAHLTSFRRITKFTTVYGSSVIQVQLPYCIRFNIYIGQTAYD